MAFSLNRWKPRHLLLSWIGYWAALVLVTLGPAISAIWRVSQLSGDKGNVSASMGNDVVSLTVTEAGALVWGGSAHLLTIVLFVALPPLVLWALWARARSPRSRAAESRVPSGR